MNARRDYFGTEAIIERHDKTLKQINEALKLQVEINDDLCIRIKKLELGLKKAEHDQRVINAVTGSIRNLP